MLATSLVAPRLEYRLRELNSSHLEALKQELLSRPMICSKPMIVVAKGLTESTDFKEEELDSYQMEVIGGNHRREVILQILKDSAIPSKDCFKFVYVHVYAGNIKCLVYVMAWGRGKLRINFTSIIKVFTKL